jgi:hypothetical protein
MMNPYNARPRAAAYAVERGVVRPIRAADSLDDMIAADIALGEPARAGAKPPGGD